MIELKRILVPTDFSDHSAVATPYACGLVERFDAELHLLHAIVSHPSSTPEFIGGLALTSYLKESRTAVDACLDRVLDPAWQQTRHVVRAIVEGPPFLEIIRYARDNDIDLIVMATHGWSGLPHIIMGSVAERVVRKAPCPVLTVRPGGHHFVMP